MNYKVGLRKGHDVYLRGIILNEAVTQSLGIVRIKRINRHPETVFLDNTNLTINFANNGFKLLKLLHGNNGEVIHNYNVAKSRVKLEIILLVNILVITIPLKQNKKITT